MDLISQCALPVEKIVWRPGHGGFAFTVVCKATFELRPDASPLAPAQEPILAADVYTAESGALALASDLVPFKKRPEVLVVGHAYAPEGTAVPSLVARIAVGEIDKAIQIVGDRSIDRYGRLGNPTPFTCMPLVWERAASGLDMSNPVGRPTGDAARAHAAGRATAPNLLPAGVRLTSHSDVVQPVGFGPVAPMWPSRAAFLHRHYSWWNPSRWHELPLPADIDLEYFNAAPPDQQRAQPFGEEAIYLEHLHPRFPRLSTRLTPVTPTAVVDHGSGPQPLHLRCDTLVIDADRGLAMLVWRAHVLLDYPDRPGRVIVLGPAAPTAALHGWAPGASMAEATLLPAAFMPSAVVLPFSGGTAPGAGSSPPPPWTGATAPTPAPPLAIPPSSETTASSPADPTVTQTLDPEILLRAIGLPFASSNSKSEPPREVSREESATALPAEPDSAGGDDNDKTLVPAPALPPSVVPFASSQGGSTPWSEAPPAPMEAQRLSPPWRIEPPALLGPVAPLPSPPIEPPAPPPLLGAIASLSERPSEVGDKERSPAVKADRPDEVPPADPEPEVAIDAYPPERCGAIAARLACDEGSTSDILRAEDLDSARWKRVHEHWLDRIRDEAARSRRKLLFDYDDAYVNALEAQRGPIALDDYARLAEAAERSAVAGALAEHGLPEGAWPHIHRVWIGRMVRDARLGKQVRAAIDAVRAA
jgi:hypothetical protein